MNSAKVRRVAFSIFGLAILLAVSPAAAQSFSTASAINNARQIAGGSCVAACATGFHAFLLDRRGFHDLGTFGGFASLVFGINDEGDVVGQSDTTAVDASGAAISLAFLADRHGVHGLGTLPGFDNSQAFAINNEGTIVGRVYSGDPEDPANPTIRAFVYRDGVMRLIGTLGGGTSVAFGVDDSARVVGRSRTAIGEEHAFVLHHGTMRDLGTLGGDRSTARAINDRGQIAGGSRTAIPGQRTHAFLYEHGVMRDLGTLGGNLSEAFAINDRGDIVGASRTASGDIHAFLFTGGAMRDLGTLGGSYSFAFGINNRGDVVGEAETASGDVHAFLFKNGVMIDLGTLP